MKLYDNGCFFTVSASVRDVAEFAARWPGFGDVARVAFEFDKRNGDLVDVIGGDGMDEGGLLALSQDCQAFGRAQFERKAARLPAMR